ncbi:MAG: 3'-5' exoribonuclease [Bacteroidales bacterium]|nr:3'-5' exoribonuclease [Bacteroidales bacterium]
MNFTAIDIETAQGPRWSICQIGLVKVENFKIIDEVSFLIQPPDNEYSSWNTKTHGITANDTKDSPIFPELWDEIKPFIENQKLVAHNASFDIDCLTKTLELYDIKVPEFEHSCTMKSTGAKLDEICQAYNIELVNHHDALCDARACANVFLKLLNKEKPDFSKVIREKKTDSFMEPGHERIKGELLQPDLENGNPDSPFYNKKIVFTGVLEKISRQEAAEIVKNLGADIDTGITKRTNYVITGKAPGPSKMKKIEKYNNEGSDIKIVFENEFLEMLNS